MGEMMKNYLLTGVSIIFIMMLIIGDKGFLDDLERAVANENNLEVVSAAQNFEQVMVLEKAQSLYMKAQSLVEIGKLEANQPFVIVGEDELFYELRFGKMAAFVKKAGTTIEKRAIPSLTKTELTDSIKTINETAVYEQANLQSSVMLYLAEGFRYPIVGETEDWFNIEIGGRVGYIRKQSVKKDAGVPVLVYHHILPKADMKTTTSTVSVEAFNEQMAYLASKQFTTLTTEQLYDYLEGRQILPVSAVLITFDDGLLSTKEYAYPVLKEYGFKAVQHIISSRTARAEGMQTFDKEGPLQFFTAQEMTELADVFQYEAHTHELHSLSDEGRGIGTELPTEQLIEDLQQNLTQVPDTISLAYPFGHYNEKMIDALKEVGLLIGFTTNDGYANMKDSNYEVNRFGITEKRTFEQFTTYVDGEMMWN